MTALISDSQVIEHFSMEQCVEAVRRAFLADGTTPLDVSERKTVSISGGARLLSLTAASSESQRLVANVYTGAPVGADKRLSTINRRQKLYILFDASSGECEAIIGGAHLAWMKTGATGAIAIEYLSSPEARHLAIVGSGRQARAALTGALTVRNFETVRVWSPNAPNVEEFVRAFSHVDGISAVDSARSAVEDADVIITATTSSQPVLRRDWLKDGFHINAIGAHRPSARELDTRTVSDSSIFVDTLVAASTEKGELLLAAEEGAFRMDAIIAELGHVVAGVTGWKRSEDENTVFASSGSAIESLGAAIGALEAIPLSTRREVTL